MQMLSEDDLNLAEMSDAELDAAWDLWFDLAQETNDFDPEYSHGSSSRFRAGSSDPFCSAISHQLSLPVLVSRWTRAGLRGLERKRYHR